MWVHDTYCTIDYTPLKLLLFNQSMKDFLKSLVYCSPKYPASINYLPAKYRTHHLAKGRQFHAVNKYIFQRKYYCWLKNFLQSSALQQKNSDSMFPLLIRHIIGDVNQKCPELNSVSSLDRLHLQESDA